MLFDKPAARLCPKWSLKLASGVMSIEFPCSQCGKLLRVGDDAAGKQARCPACNTVQAIPSAASVPQGAIGALPSGPSAPRLDENPYQAPASAPWYPEVHGAFGPVPQGAFQPTPIDAGDVLNRTWIIFKSQFWMMALAGFIFWICQIGFNVVVGQVVTLAVIAGGGGQPNQKAFFASQFVLQVISFVFGTWLEIGMAIYMLKTARGQAAGLGDIFAGGRFLPPAVLARFLYYLGWAIGSLLLIVPGIIFALMFSQFLYLLIDRGHGVLDSLGGSKTLTGGNKLNVFVLALATVGVGLIGALACCVGAWPAMGFVELMWAVAYLTMTGQPTVDALLVQPLAATPFAPPTPELR